MRDSMGKENTKKGGNYQNKRRINGLHFIYPRLLSRGYLLFKGFWDKM